MVKPSNIASIFVVPRLATAFLDGHGGSTQFLRDLRYVAYGKSHTQDIHDNSVDVYRDRGWSLN
jgi:hypothetical protein